MWPGLIEAVRIFHSVGGATPITNDPTTPSGLILGSGLTGGIWGGCFEFKRIRNCYILKLK
ncbi:hypothetical protein LEP1GSC087_1117 [Leptospira interrogans serovar Bataviae str. L1111]|nr:hypothetical protein LEP1GSC087_1117 [Leptospira interrogans serovar Bataviae str. L1111]